MNERTAYRQEAIEMKLALKAGLVDCADVIAWADRVLEANDYDDDVANVCFAREASVQDMLSLLGRVAGQADEWAAMRTTMGKMHRLLLRDPALAGPFARFLEGFWIRHEYRVPDDMAFIAAIDDKFQLAQNGTYGTVEDLTLSLIENLARYDESPGA